MSGLWKFDNGKKLSLHHTNSVIPPDKRGTTFSLETRLQLWQSEPLRRPQMLLCEFRAGSAAESQVTVKDRKDL
jgi:hypothetical protein